MAVRLSGSEWKQFLKSRPEGWHYKDAHIVMDGLITGRHADLSKVPDDVVIQIAGGLSVKSPDGRGGTCLESVVRNWRTGSKYIRMVVEVSKEDMLSVREAVEKAGGLILM